MSTAFMLTKERHALEAKIEQTKKELGRLERQHRHLILKATGSLVLAAMATPEYQAKLLRTEEQEKCNGL